MPEPLRFTDAEKAAYRATYAPGASDTQWNLFILECERRALVPGVHVVFNLRSANEWNPTLRESVSVQKVALITTINALRLIAERGGKYEGHSPFIYYYGAEGGDDFTESKIPLGRVPHAVSVEGFRKDWKVPLFATARYDAYVQMKGRDNAKTPTMMWATRGEEQLAKCCEALMLRAVAPEECAGLLITEELGNDAIDREETPVPNAAPVTVPQATVAPVVNQAPAPTPEVTKTVNPAISGFITVEAPDMSGLIATIVPMPVQAAVVAPVVASAPAVDPKPLPQTAPPRAAPMPSPSTSLFSHTTPPDPANETRVFQTPVSGYVPATPAEYNVFTAQRATKIVRDVLTKGGMNPSESGNAVKNYLLKGSGKTALKLISAADFERLLSAVEKAETPEEAVAIVRAVK